LLYPVHALADPAPLEADDARWSAAAAIEWGDAPYRTRFRALWSPAALHIRFDAADLNPWSTKTDRDDRLWEEEVVEIFLDPARRGRDYAELEISPANVVCDLVVRSPWPRLVSDPAWHFDGLETAVVSWRDPDAGPAGWTALARIPWGAFRSIAPGVRIPPEPDEVWRFNVYRIKRPSGPERPMDDVRLMAWSPTGGPSFHVPERFGEMKFVRGQPLTANR
jgi:hypothetical protein